MAAVSKGLKTNPENRPIYPKMRASRLPESKIRIAKKLKRWKEKKAADLAIDPALVLNKSQTMDIARISPAAIKDLEELTASKTGRFGVFGEAIIRCIDKK